MYEQHQGVELKPLPTAKFSSIKRIVSTYQSLCQRTRRGRNVKSQNKTNGFDEDAGQFH